QGPFREGMTAAMPGRRTPLRKRLRMKPPATMAPVLPALTMPSTLRCASSCQQRVMELSGFLRSPSTGDSSMVTTWVQWKRSMRSWGPPAPARAGSTWTLSPTRVTRNSGSAWTACTAPATIGPGAWSPPIASSAISMGSLLLFRGHDFAALVVPAVRADAVRQHRLVALAAVLDLLGLEVVVTAPHALSGA